MITIHTTATLTPTAPTPKDRSTARVIRGTLGMESRVLVINSVLYEISFSGLIVHEQT